MRTSASAKLEDQAVRHALESILASPQFVTSPRASRFLRFVVETELAGGSDSLKESVLAVEVFDRKPSFDPTIDTIVRVEAVKLRQRLRDYYRGPGRSDPLIVDVPKGGYRARFRPRAIKTPGRRSRRKERVSIAVLPFVNLSPDPGQDFWSDGLTEELISALARTRQLLVVSGTSAFSFKGSKMDIREIGRQLGVDLVVEGSVRTSGRQIRIAVRLVKVSTGFQLWSETLDRNVEDVWQVQQEVANAVNGTLQLELNAKDVPVPKTYVVNPEAFELYLKARHTMQRADFPSQHEAMALFERALAADASYPLPLIGMARSHMRWAMIGLEPPGQRVALARATLDQALERDPQLAEAHALLALVISRHEWRWAEAKKHHQQALQLAPYSAEVHNAYATEYLAPLGRFDEALAENRRARELDLFSPYIALGYPYILLHARRYAEAADDYRRIFAEHPKMTGIRGGVAFALWGQGRFQHAAAEFEVANVGFPGGSLGEVFLSAAKALCGECEAAFELLERLKLRQASEFVRAMDFAFLHLALGQREECITALEQAYRNQEHPLVWAKVSFIFDPLRDHPRFQALLSSLGFH